MPDGPLKLARCRLWSQRGHENSNSTRAVIGIARHSCLLRFLEQIRPSRWLPRCVDLPDLLARVHVEVHIERPCHSPLLRLCSTHAVGADMTQKRKIIVQIATSADGYIARPDGNVDWLTRRPAPKGFYGMPKFMRSVDAKVLVARPST